MKNEKYSWIQDQHDTTLYGLKLAKRVAKQLKSGKNLIYDHRDYCGKGLVYYKKHYYYITVHDGYIILNDRDITETCQYMYDKSQLKFTRTEFVNWLAAQSDESMSGIDEPVDWMQDNQRITRKRLEEFC